MSIRDIFRKKIDESRAAELADIMIRADVAPNIATEIAGKLRQSDDPKKSLEESLLYYAKKLERPPISCLVSRISILIVGVNGAGKTTTIGKLAKQFADAGHNVIIGACDTFRAAANEQLDAWAARAGANIVHGTEPAAVAYKTIEALGENGIALLDTAGRLHNRSDLMAELAKIGRVMKKIDAGAPTETWLVLDGTTGQNALAQIEFFNRATPLTGLVITKMDGTSKGGFLISYAANEPKPLGVAYIGDGEKIEDLKPFDAKEYVEKIFEIAP